jgi:hypothetical protein
MHPPRPKRLPLLAGRRALRLPSLGLVAAACALGGCASVAASGSPGSSRQEVAGALVRAHTLPDDRLLAGPVLLDHRAVWVEAGHRLLVRSLDAHGRTRTLFSTSKTPGAPKGTLWPFYVRGIAVGNGQVAFIESVIPCASAPPGTPRCAPGGGEGRAADSVTLFAGPPGAIRPVESLVPPRPGCQGPPEPVAVAVASAGLVVYEVSTYPAFQCGSVSRLALRTFSGRLVRVLADGLPVVTRFNAAGDWVALLKRAQVVGKQDEVQIIRAKTGQVALRLHARIIQAFAVNSSGTFALMTEPRRGPCELGPSVTVLSGQIGQPGMRVLTREAVGDESTSTALAVSGRQVAYAQPTRSCSPGGQLVVGTPGAPPRPVPGLELGTRLAFDGSVVATAHDDTVALAVLRRR